MRKLGFASLVALLMISSPGWAVDPTVAGNTLVGTHPSYGSNFSAVWRTGADYGFLTDGYHSYINAPNQDGGVYVRNANANVAVFAKNQINLQKDTYFEGWLIANAWSSFSGPMISYGGISSYGYLMVQGNTQLYNQLRVDAPVVVYGETNLNGKLTVNADVGLWGNVTVGLLNAQNSYTGKPGGGPWQNNSDRRVKKDIVDYHGGLAELEQIHTVRYKYNGLGGTQDSEQEFIGVIAQELEQVAPYMVSSQKRKLHPTDTTLSDIKQVDGNAFTYMLVNAVQTLSERNKAATKQSKELERQTEALARQTEALERQTDALARQTQALEQQNRELKALICQDHPTAAVCSKRLAQR